MVSTAPSLKSWTQLFLSLIRENPTSVSSISHIHLIFFFLLLLNLFNLSETSASFQCLDLQGPHLRPFQDKSTVSYQDNKCSLPVLSFSYWTPSSKNPWWMDSQLKFLAPTRLRKLHNHHNSAFTTRQSWMTQTNSFLNRIWTLNPAPQSSQRSSQTHTTLLEHFSNVSHQRV